MTCDFDSRRCSYCRHIYPDHATVLRDLGYVLTLNNGADWEGFSVVLVARLTVRELVELVRAALRALYWVDHDQAIATISPMGGAGQPYPPFLNVMREARDWAAFASQRELDAYAAACFLAMPKHRKREFLLWATPEVVSD